MFEIILTSSTMILTIMVLRLCFRKQVSSCLLYGTWGLVALRLLLPAGEGGWEISFLQNFFDTSLGFITAGQLLIAIWLLGAVTMAVWLLWVNVSFRAKLRRNAEPFPCPESKVPVWICEDITTPCLFGLFKPAVYLTSACAQDATLRSHVLTHELTHLRHWDHIWAVVRCVCLCVYWFNPLVWIGARLSKQDSELACDEGALRRLGDGQRIPYGKSIVDLVATSRAATYILEAGTGMQESPRTLKNRVKAIAGKKKLVLAAAVCVGLLAAAIACLWGVTSILLSKTTVEQVEILSQPYRSAYVSGQSLDTTGLQLKLTYTDGTTEVVEEGFTCSPTQLDTLGEQVISVTYQKKTVNFSVTVGTVKKSGNCGPKLTWTLTEDYDLIIEGNGQMGGYGEGTAPWAKFADQIRSVYLSPWATSIGSYAFAGCSKITQLRIPASVTYIGAGAFYECTGLESIQLHDGITHIGEEAFYYCKMLKSIQVPAGVTTISSKTFYLCNRLESVTLPAGLTTIKSDAFHYCGALTQITIPDGVTAIGSGAFTGCWGLQEVTIPGSVRYLSECFSHCKNLKNITICQGVEGIYSSFTGCDALTTLRLPASVKTIDHATFRDAVALQAIYVDPKNPHYTSDEQGVLYTKDMVRLVRYPIGREGSYTIAKGCRIVDKQAFRDAKYLTNIVFSDTVNVIENHAFANCASLKTVIVPETVTKIQRGAFSCEQTLTKIFIKNPNCEIDMLSNTTLGLWDTTTLYGFAGSTTEAYAAATNQKFVALS